MNKPAELRLPAREATIDRLSGWAEAQLAPWRNLFDRDAQALAARLDEVEAASPFVFLFDFDASSVSLRPKACAWTHPVVPAANLLGRAGLYLALFRDVLAGFRIDRSFTLAVDVDDHPTETPGVPTFAFQKHTHSPLILLPDVDILAHDHFVSPQYDDAFDFDEKADAAIFVGATTGHDLTREVVETLAMPRLKSAVFFRDVPDVTFHLPKIVQYDTEETADMVRALGVTGSPASWQDQFAYRYLLSMDGNGATCSRVAIALKSRSVLIKYASDFQLFYFDGLVSGTNFLNVETDEDVSRSLVLCREHPGRTSAIAAAGQAFAREHLSRLPVLIYVAALLDGYSRTVLRQVRRDPADLRGLQTVIDGYAHIQNIGDMRPRLGGWLGSVDRDCAIEGFALEPGPGVSPDDVSYQAVLPDGQLSQPCSGFEFCGTRGQNRGLRGVRIALRGEAAIAYELSYLATFADGSEIGPTSGDVVCRSPGGAALTGLRLRVEERDSGGSARM